MPKETEKLAKVLHFALFGKREEKYDFLLSNSLDSVSWNALAPAAT